MEARRIQKAGIVISLGVHHGNRKQNVRQEGEIEMKLAHLRDDAPRERFPVFISNSGRSHCNAQLVARRLSTKWGIHLEYTPDPDGCKQGTFYLNAAKLGDLEIEGINPLISRELARYPIAYDVACPR